MLRQLAGAIYQSMNIVLLGAGKMAYAIAYDLLRDAELHSLLVLDHDHARARKLTHWLKDKRVRAAQCDVTRRAALTKACKGAQVIIGATTYCHNLLASEVAIAIGAHFCDLGGNNDVVAAQLALNARAKERGVTIIPDCGLAPGLVNVLGYHYATQLDITDTLELRVGGLPSVPGNQLGYQLVFSVTGLINEYIEPALVLENGKKKRVPSMQGEERLAFAPPFHDLEAFYTSGGTSTLPKTLARKVRNLNYKTIRYPGHAKYIQLLMDLGLCDSTPVTVGKAKVAPRALLEQLLSAYLPQQGEDVVLVRIKTTGTHQGVHVSHTYDCVSHFDRATGLSAMARMTGFPVAIVTAMLGRGEVRRRGVVPGELAVDGESFLRALAARGIIFHEHG